jgi:ubiquinone/menaquinone biosynthesis C-methylase UbiE
MTVKGMYNKISSHYAMADRFGSISQSHAAAISQIQSFKSELKDNARVLDLGVGDGSFLEKLKIVLPDANMTAIDLSASMLALAKEKLAMTAIECSATEADKYLPAHSQDLILAHFINAYIPINDLFMQADHLSRANGLFSMITTTYDSFPTAQKQLAEFIAEDNFVSSVVGHYYKNIVRNTTVAAGQDELLNTFKTHQFEILSHQRLEIPIELHNVEELANFGIEGTWFLNSLSVRMLPKNFLLNRLKRLFNKIFTFPYHDKHIIDIVLAKK